MQTTGVVSEVCAGQTCPAWRARCIARLIRGKDNRPHWKRATPWPRETMGGCSRATSRACCSRWRPWAWPLPPTSTPISVDTCHSLPSPPFSLIPPLARTCRPWKLLRSLMLVTPASASAPYTDEAPPVITSMLPMAICGIVLRSTALEALAPMARRPVHQRERAIDAQAAQVDGGGTGRVLPDARVVDGARRVEHVAGGRSRRRRRPPR